MKMLLGIAGQLLIITVALVLLLSWPVNVYKLTQCDFESDYKCEVLHGVGLVPGLSPITVWFGTDE